MSKEKSKVESGLDAIFASISSNIKEINQVNNKKKLNENVDKVSTNKVSTVDGVSTTKVSTVDEVSTANMSTGQGVYNQSVYSRQSGFAKVSTVDRVSTMDKVSTEYVLAHHYFLNHFLKYIAFFNEIHPTVSYFLNKFCLVVGYRSNKTYRELGKLLNMEKRQVLRYFDKAIESHLIEKESTAKGTYITIIPLLENYLKDNGMFEISAKLFGEFLFEQNMEFVDRLSTYLPSMYVSSFIYKEETNNIQTEKKFEIPNNKTEEFRRIIFWLYWFGIDYKDARVNNIRMLLEVLESEADVDTILMSIVYTGEKSLDTKIDNKWAYFLRGVGKYGTEGVKLKEFGEIKTNIEKLYELAKLTEAQRENFLIENNYLIQFVREKTREEIIEKPKKIDELKILETKIMTAYNSIDKFMELNKIGVELNIFEKSRLHRNKDPRAGGPSN